MDALIRQMRTRSRGGGPSEPEEDRTDINGVSSLRSTRSSGGKINKEWFPRLYSRQLGSSDSNHTPSGDDETAIAIAAAAYAVISLDEPDHEAMIVRGQQDPSLSSKGIQDSKENGPVKTIQKRATFSEELLPDRTESDKPKQLLQEEEEDLPKPLQKPQKKTSSSSTTSTAASPLPLPPPKFPATMPGNPPLFEIQSQATPESTATRLPVTQLANWRPKGQIGVDNTGGGASEVDACERDKMARIRDKYETIIQVIVTWEENKKRLARRKLDENEREIERRRAKASKEFQTEMERIGQVAGAMKARAEERRRKEELETREKGERIRRSGKARSKACFCF